MPAKIVTHHLALARVNTGADLDTKRLRRIDDGSAAANRAGRSVEARKEAVAGRVDLAATMAFELLAHGEAMMLEKLLPSAIAHRDGPLGRANDVGEQERG